MQAYLKSCLHSYIIQNNPDLVLALQGGHLFDDYLEEKVATVGPYLDKLIAQDAGPATIEAECMQKLTEDLCPSKFAFITALLRRRFPNYYTRLKEAGTLTYEVTNMIAYCFELFETFGFDVDSSGDEGLLFALADAVRKYLSSEHHVNVA